MVGIDWLVFIIILLSGLLLFTIWRLIIELIYRNEDENDNNS